MSEVRRIEGIVSAEESGDGADASVEVARQDLQKRRWRAVASDGVELAFALDGKLRDGALLKAGGQVYRLTQVRETVIAVALPDDPKMAAKFGWYFGNRHISIEVRDAEIVVEEFPTLTESLDRIGIPYIRREDVLNCPPHSEHRH